MLSWLDVAMLSWLDVAMLSWLDRLMLLRLSLNQGPLAAIETQYQ